ncbi:hypothetical protein SAMN05428642_103450 [Flaviramulus basaltis]|uniref:Uncharacterized protein n=1 Tax=Flaviramulus basaltis TaxID=369401 RepID=A0A1K2INS4_9FLAO|nr:hypothetical protein [Flaviramulus basaltis]SFZ93950.1 hypothetical protein SAMN05428642_103450 [Flaviramulus basaltis]
MIKLFRNVRKNLLNEGKTSKYIKYAVGEIVLVVIGILIALQINNWNQNRVSKIEELSILKNIHSEFIQNKKVLQSTIHKNSICLNTSITLINLVGQDNETINKQNVDSLFYYALEAGTFRPSENTIFDLLQSGRLQLLQNENLKDLLYEWTRSMKSVDVSFKRVELKIDNELIPYLSKKYSLKDIDVYGNLKWKNKTLLKVDKLQIFEDIEFENIMDDYLYRIISNKEKLNELTILIDDILKETK